jgi:hypothetical protein
VLAARFKDGMHISATPRRHHVCFQLAQHPYFECRMHEARLMMITKHHELTERKVESVSGGVDPLRLLAQVSVSQGTAIKWRQ